MRLFPEKDAKLSTIMKYQRNAAKVYMVLIILLPLFIYGVTFKAILDSGNINGGMQVLIIECLLFYCGWTANESKNEILKLNTDIVKEEDCEQFQVSSEED